MGGRVSETDELVDAIASTLRSVSQYVDLSRRFQPAVFSPYILKHAQPEPFINGEHLVASSSKLIVIDKLLADILPKGEQVLIFSVSQMIASMNAYRLTQLLAMDGV